MLAVGVWTTTRPSSVALPILHRSSVSSGGSALAVGGDDLPVDVAAPPRNADQLHSMDPAAIDRYAASEDANTRSGQGKATPTKGTWLVGGVGTYLVGRGISVGKYASAGASQGKLCRWGVKESNGATARSGSGMGRVVVTIHQGDGFFETNDCANWQKLS